MSDLAFKPITPQFGAELADITLLDLDATGIQALQQLAAERGVVVARNQVMTMQEQVDFGKRLGTLLTTPINEGRIPEELLVINANEKSKKVPGQGWHSDASSEAIPPGLSMLRMELVPNVGGDTLFADMYQAFEALSEAMQIFLKGLNARHDPKGHYLYLSGVKQLHELPSAVHPVVRTHPLTGRQSLYVNSGFVGKIVELNDSESRALLNMLYDHIAYNVSAQCRVSWQPDTVTFWDNRCVQHHAAFDYFPARRRGYRVTVVGEAPTL